MEKFTFKDLKEAIENLTEEQLNKQVSAVGEDETTKISGLYTTEEDIYSNIDDNDDRGTLQELKDIYGDDFNITDYELATSAGHPFLSLDF